MVIHQVPPDDSTWMLITSEITYAVKKNATVPVEVAIFHIYYSGGPGRDPLPDDFSILSGDPDLTEEEYIARGDGGVDWVSPSQLREKDIPMS